MKNLLKTCLLVLICSTIGRSQIASGEYFWDTDPGINLATPIPASVFVGVTNDTYSFSPPTTGISPGIHRVFFRLKDNTGNLSQIVSQVVYIGETGIPSIAEDEVGLLEYYWDDNSASPTQITLTNPPVNGDYQFTVPSTGLIAGSHKLHMRIKDKYGLWSGLYEKSILIFGNSPLPNIQKIEYYVDTDPGEGSAISVSFSPSTASDVTSNFEIPTTGLANGQHVATMRVQDANGLWSGKFSKAFEVDPQFSLTAGGLPSIYYCLGGTIEVPITRTGVWPSGNEYVLELSDQTGQNFEPIPTSTSFGGSGDKLIGTIPSNLAISGGYKIRAVTTLPYIRKTSTTTFTIGITATASSNTPVCAGTPLNLTSTSSTPATYSWSGSSGYSSTVQNPTISSPVTANSGTYTLTATNTGGCSATATTVVLVNPLPNSTASSNAPICAGQTLNLNASGGANYAWAGPNSFTASTANPILSNATTATSGTYTVTVTSALGCVKTTTTLVTVNPLPIATANSNSPVCFGQTLNLTANGGANYAWSGPNSFTASTANPNISNVTTVASGTYSVIVTSAAGCVKAATTLVTVNSLPSASTSSNAPICDGQTLSLTANGGATYTWTGPNSFTASTATPTISNATTTASGTYTVTVTSAASCVKTATTLVTVNPLPNPTASSNSPICSGQTLSLTASGGATYSWIGPNGFTSNTTSASIVNTSTAANGTYTVTVTSNLGCSAISTVTVTINVKPNLITHTQNLATSSPVNLTLPAVIARSSLPGGTTLSYFTNSAATTTLTNPTMVTVEGIYYIKATSPSGCIDIKAVSVIGNCLGAITLVSPTDDKSTGNGVKVSSQTITASNKITSTANYIMDAKKAVVLQPGFLAGGGNVVFRAQIGGCP
ncbi:hypothetical protein SAMN06298216_4221 [Spirosomataceae bacterium TFI 002]|nr:hypothetical protein SAMN06298216_4221 [Spirosomataceae bacterium TFI 002]